jgi:hypothetical protein
LIAEIVQLLLPTVDGEGVKVPLSKMRSLARELSDRFGGVTSFLRAPAEGLWQPHENAPAEKDDIVIFDVMAEDLDEAFWRSLRVRLKADLGQSEIIVRAQPVDLL